MCEEEFHLGYQLTRFLYARDEVQASYICSLFSETNPSSNSHYFWLAELLESGFHGDVICSLIQGLVFKYIAIDNDNTPYNINEYIQQFIHNITIIQEKIEDYNSQRDNHEPIFSLHDLHNDNQYDDPDCDEYDVYDNYKYNIYNLSTIVNHYSATYLGVLNTERPDDDIDLDMITKNMENIKLHKPKTDIDIEELFQTKLQLTTSNNSNGLYTRLKEIILLFDKNTLIRATIYKGPPKKWKSSYPYELYPLLRKIQDLRVIASHKNDNKITYQHKIQLLQNIISIYRKHIRASTKSLQQLEKIDIIQNIYGIMEHIQDFGLQILDCECINIQHIMDMITCDNLFKDYIIYDGNDEDDFMNICHLIDNNMFDMLMICLLYIQSISCIHGVESYNSFNSTLSEIVLEDNSYANIESLRNTNYQLIVLDKNDTTNIETSKILPYRALLPIHNKLDIFSNTLTKNIMGITWEKARYIREFEWENYCIFTPLWFYRFSNYCKCGQKIPYDMETCEFNLEDVKCCGECYDIINLDFVEQPLNIKYRILGNKQ